MKKYAFRLDTVRRVRRVQEDQAKAELLRKNTAVRQATATVDAKGEAYAKSTSYAPTHIASMNHFMRQRYFNELAGMALVAAKSSLAAAHAEAAIARELWSDAAKKVRTLDRLDDRSRKEYEVEAKRQEVIEADDLVSGRWIRAHAESGARP